MREDELKEQKSISERLDSINRQKYYCSKCKSNHYMDSEIGIKHHSLTETVFKNKKFEERRKQEESIKEYEKWLHEHYSDPEFIKMNLNAYKKDKKNIEI